MPPPGGTTRWSGLANCLGAPRGAIGAAVITAAMRSADLTRRALAGILGVSPVDVHGWETGTIPLYRVSYQQLRQLAEALSRAGERTGLDLATLILASQCDLLVAGMLGAFEDYAEVPPIEDRFEGQAARSLLRWALTGDVPEPYRPFARRGPLLTRSHTATVAAMARELARSSASPDLASYGTAFLALTAT